MAIAGKRLLGGSSQNLAMALDPWNQSSAVLVRTALALPKTLHGPAEIISALLGALNAKSPHTASHCLRVGEYARQLAAALDMPEAQVDHVERCGLLHDVGKLGVPEAVLDKSGRLTEEEWGLIKLHPIIGAAVLRGCPSLQPLVPAIAMHHERWDGEGYPYGARGMEIPVEARILTICDAFDTMTSERPYKRAMEADTACFRLMEAKGSQFEPELVDLFIEQVVKGR
ncbi:MAG: HD-GYP domain-containing protein [Bacillota bacterium]